MAEEKEKIEENVEIEVEEAEAEEKQEEVVAQEAETEQPSSDSEHEEYSEGVKKRIDRLTYKMREAERREQAALEYAKNIKEENEKLRAEIQKYKSLELNVEFLKDENKNLQKILSKNMVSFFSLIFILRLLINLPTISLLFLNEFWKA